MPADRQPAALHLAALALAAAIAGGDGRADALDPELAPHPDAGAGPPVCDQDAAPPPEIEKEYPALDAPARGSGRVQIATTLFNIHTREALPILAKRTPAAALQERFFRDRGFGATRALDPRLLETVLAAAAEFAAPRIDVISAYRSPKMNESLGKKGRHVATESRHTLGEAIDFSVPGVPARRVGEWLWQSFDGGLGVYDEDGFVHIDVGPKRRWRG